MVWEVPTKFETIAVIPIPTVTSELNLTTDSFEIEFFGSFTKTLPIIL